MEPLAASTLKTLSFVAGYVPALLGWAISAAAKIAVGEYAKNLLKTGSRRKAYAAALRRAFAQFAKEFPSLSSALFDEHFLRGTIAQELALFLTRDQTPRQDNIVAAYKRQFVTPPNIDISSAIVRFLALVEAECKKEAALQELLTHRQTDETHRILRGIGQSLTQTMSDDAAAAPSIDIAALRDAFRAASQELLDWPSTLDGDRWLDRPELVQLLDRIATSESSVSLLLGVPGSGKSALLARLAREAHARNWAVLAIKADQLPEGVASLGDLRKHVELPIPIVEAVRALAQQGKVVLLIDQLDALSELIDLKTSRLTALLRLINQTKDIPNVHVLSSCRSFERTYDRRLNTIDADEIQLALPPWETVQPLLRERGLDAGAWPEAFREILRVPQCLKLFLRHFSGIGESQVFATYQAMLEQLWRERLFAGPLRTSASALVLDIATEMAEREVLFVPTARFDSRRDDLDCAVASGILQYDHTGRQLSFTHQTLFDFARARAFIAKEQSLSHYVLERQGALFVRPKLWSALNYLRGADRDAYVTELRAIWGAAGLRAHIKTLLIDFVGQQEQPLDSEILLLRSVVPDKTYGPNALAAIAGRKAWFDAIERDLLPDAMSGSKEKAWATINVLEAASAHAQPRVLELIRTHWLPNPERRTHAWYALRGLRQWDRDALALAVRIVREGSIANSMVQDLAAVISASAPDLAPELIGAHLRKKVDEAKAARESLVQHSQDDASGNESVVAFFRQRQEDPLRQILEGHAEWYEVAGVAEAAPKAYLEHVWPPIRDAIEVIASEDRVRPSMYQSDHLLATMLEVDMTGEGRNREYPLMDSFIYAVRECVAQHQGAFRSFVAANASSNAMTVHRILAIGLCHLAPSDPQFALDYLLGDVRRLSLENFHEHERETKMLLRALVPYLSADECARLEDAILKTDIYRDIAPEKDAKERMRLQKLNRLFRLRLLWQFPLERLTARARELIESETHIFRGYQDERREVTTWVSRSPLSAEKMLQSKNDTIRRFLDGFPDATGWGDGFADHHGGSIEASRAFAAFAKQDTKRALEIIRTLNPATHQRPAAYAVRELTARELPDAELFGLVLELDRNGFHGIEFRECAAEALRKRVDKPGTGLPDAITDLLERWLDEYEVPAEAEEAEVERDTSDEDDRSESLLWGLGRAYAIPGGSYPILNALFFGLIARRPVPSDRLLGALERHIAKRDRIQVWNALTSSTLSNVRYCDPERAQDFLGALFAAYPALLAGGSGLFLAARSLDWVSPDVTRRWIEAIRNTEWARAPQAYGELLVLRSVLLKDDQWSRTEIERFLAGGDSKSAEDTKAFCGLVHAAAHLSKEARDRSPLTDILCAGMDSPDKHVAGAAIDWFRIVDDVRLTEATRPIIEALASGRSLETVGTRGYVLDRVSDLVGDAPELIYRISRRVIDLYKSDIGNLATSAATESETLLTIALTLQRMDEPHRSHGLELFEQLLHYNAYKVRDVLMDIDRRPGASVPPTQIRRRRRKKHERALDAKEKTPVA